MWLSVVLGGLLLVPTLLMPETHGPTILRKRAKRQEHNEKMAKTGIIIAELESRKKFVAEALGRPFRLLFGEWLVFLSSFYIALMSGIL